MSSSSIYFSDNFTRIDPKYIRTPILFFSNGPYDSRWLHFLHGILLYIYIKDGIKDDCHDCHPHPEVVTPMETWHPSPHPKIFESPPRSKFVGTLRAHSFILLPYKKFRSKAWLQWFYIHWYSSHIYIFKMLNKGSVKNILIIFMEYSMEGYPPRTHSLENN